MKKIQLILAVSWLCVPAMAQIPDVLNFQGRLISGTNLYNGPAGIELRLYTQPSGGMAQCIDSNIVDVVDGLYSTYIGDNVVWGSLDVALMATSLWLEVAIDGTALSPREQVVSVAYARLAATLPSGAVKDWMIADGQIYAHHIVDNQITSNKIADSAITSEHLAEGAVAFENLQRGYDAGSFAIIPNSRGFYTNVTQSFTEPFQDVPVVTMNLAFDMAIANLNTQLLLQNSTVSNFTAQIRVDPFDLPVGSPLYITARGWYPSLKMVNDRVSCAFVDASDSYALKFVRSANAMGTSWSSFVPLYTNGTVGQGPSMAMVNGNPAIAFCDTDSGTLYYQRSSDGIGYSGWNARQTVDSTLSAGEYASLAMIQGRPAISYYRAGITNLMFIRANNSNGTSWTAGNAVAAVSNAQVSGSTTLLEVDGSPAICYYDTGSDDLKFVRAADAYGSNWWPAVTVASAGDVGAYCSMAIVDGSPAISYMNRNTYTNLMYVRSANAQGSSWGSPLRIDTNGITGFYTSLCVIQGNPAIAYSESTNGATRYVRAADSIGSSWNAPVSLNYPGITIVGRGSSLEDVNGAAGIMFNTWIPQQTDFITVTNVNISVNWMAIEN